MQEIPCAIVPRSTRLGQIMAHPQELQDLGRRLDRARMERKAIERLTLEKPELSLSDSYAIQALGIHTRLSNGEKIVGYKMGLTSKAKREQMGLHQSIYGVLTDQMQIQSEFEVSTGIHPKIEPEIAFLVRDPIRASMSRTEALDACGAVAAALEILDSRFVGFKYFSLPDVVADNSSSSKFVVGAWVESFQDLDLRCLSMCLCSNGNVVEKADSSAILGDPVLSLLELAQLLGHDVPAGAIVLAGAATAATPLKPGLEIECRVDGLPNARVRVV